MRGVVLLLLAGVLLAAALGYATHLVAQDTIGLPAVSLELERPLAPPESGAPAPAPAPVPTPTPTQTETNDDDGDGRGRGRGRNRGRGGGDD